MSCWPKQPACLGACPAPGPGWFVTHEHLRQTPNQSEDNCSVGPLAADSCKDGSKHLQSCDDTQSSRQNGGNDTAAMTEAITQYTASNVPQVSNCQRSSNVQHAQLSTTETNSCCMTAE